MTLSAGAQYTTLETHLSPVAHPCPAIAVSELRRYARQVGTKAGFASFEKLGSFRKTPWPFLTASAALAAFEGAHQARHRSRR
jgi:hypothetical protein